MHAIGKYACLINTQIFRICSGRKNCWFFVQGQIILPRQIRKIKKEYFFKKG